MTTRSWFAQWFVAFGRFNGRFATRICLLSFLGFVMFGYINYFLVVHCHKGIVTLQNDPQRLWVSPQSVTWQQQQAFNQHFGDFFRVNQLIFYLPPDLNGSETSPLNANRTSNDHQDQDLIEKPFLVQLAHLQQQIETTSFVANVSRNENDRSVHDRMERNLTLQEFCFRPIAGKGCLVTSPFQYWRNNLTTLETEQSLENLKKTVSCQTQHEFLKQFPSCMDENGIPVMRKVVFGGISNDSCHKNPDPCGDTTPSAKALMVTFLLNNFPQNASYNALVQQWEKQVFLKLAQQAAFNLSQEPHVENTLSASTSRLKLTFMAERSVSDALAVQTKENAFIVVISYLCMFGYISMALGNWKDKVQSRYVLGMTGILIVVLSLGISMVLCCQLFQMEITMITLEVVPFLILAIGVDNMFILTNEFDRLALLHAYGTIPHPPVRPAHSSSSNLWRSSSTSDRLFQDILAETMGNVGPSICVAAISESLALFVGVFTRIPALSTFCIVASVAVLVDFFLQITWFASALLLDAKRMRARRYDLFPWIKQKYDLLSRRPSTSFSSSSSPPSSPVSSKLKKRETSNSMEEMDVFLNQTIDNQVHCHDGIVRRFVQFHGTPFVFAKLTKVAVCVVTFAVLVTSWFGLHRLQLGLEQELAVPTDLYLHEYFQIQTRYGEAGPIGYLVLDESMNYTNATTQMEITQLVDAISHGQKWIQPPVFSWLNGFHQWRQLRFFLEGKRKEESCDCPAQPMDPFAFELPTRGAVNLSALTGQTSERLKAVYDPLIRPDQMLKVGLPNDGNVTPTEAFYPLVKTFTQIPIDSNCCQQFGLCGAQFAQDIVFQSDKHNESRIVGIQASRMRFQVNALRNQSFMINSYYYLRKLTEQLQPHASSTSNVSAIPSSWLGDDSVVSQLVHLRPSSSPVSWYGAMNTRQQHVFPYTLYFVYYEQYLTIQGIAMQSTLLALGVVFGSLVLLMDIRMATFVTLSVAAMTWSQFGWIFVWNSLQYGQPGTHMNAVLVVNLLTSIGLGVEFCVHFAYKFRMVALLRVASSRGNGGGSGHDVPAQPPSLTNRTMSPSALRLKKNSNEIVAKKAMATIGSSVISGITLTKFIGIFVLAFAPSHLFRVYFFRMYLGIVVLGFFYGLFVLPVVLSLWGYPQPKVVNTSYQELMRNYLVAEANHTDSAPQHNRSR